MQRGKGAKNWHGRSSISASRLLVLLGALCLLPLLAGCRSLSVAMPEPVVLDVAGSTEMLPLLHELTEEFSRRHPHVVFSLRGGGSTLGESWVADGRIDLAASTLYNQDEALPAGLVRVPIGLDAVAIIVNADNPVSQLTTGQLRDLYSGRILDWQEVAGEAGEVLLISREDGSGTRQLFEERMMGAEQVALTALVMPTSRDVVAYVATHPQAVGYVSQGYTRRDTATEALASQLDAIKVLRIEGRLPDRASIAGQLYPLSRPLFLLYRTEDRDRLQQFVDFVLSPPGQGIVDHYHVRIR